MKLQSDTGAINATAWPNDSRLLKSCIAIKISDHSLDWIELIYLLWTELQYDQTRMKKQRRTWCELR